MQIAFSASSKCSRAMLTINGGASGGNGINLPEDNTAASSHVSIDA